MMLSSLTNEKAALILDIGSNSIRSMKAVLKDGLFSFSRKSVFTTRLAAGISETGLLSEDSMLRSLDVIEAEYQKATADGFPVFAYATSAVRDALNREDFLKRISVSCTGLHMEVLPGELEAKLAFRGAVPSGKGCLIDIGGGSTQVISASSAQSFPLGCVRVKDLCPYQNFDELESSANTVLSERIHVSTLNVPNCTFVGGTATTVAALHLGLTAYEPEKVSSCIMTPDDLWQVIHMLDDLGAEGRKAHPLLIKRHDVILPGCAILNYLVKTLSITRLSFSDADGMEGYAMSVLSR